MHRPWPHGIPSLPVEAEEYREPAGAKVLYFHKYNTSVIDFKIVDLTTNSLSHFITATAGNPPMVPSSSMMGVLRTASVVPAVDLLRSMYEYEASK